ncbi:hypothetical protein Tdes44962_MAKER05626 [Teratosphaeria destructans]|uniref:Uncharacterized protein n=1 Tax=Teratosphaeria destructans TaxID=418781 RepID=A0A9W7VYX8_9PEZI|nr:hypothetical protein Tdes44962_MAKER05626 [Teratosphaeria destructans]
MCDYTQVEYGCGHLRWTVRAWCIRYQETHKRCPANVVAIEYRLGEKCGAAHEQSPLVTQTDADTARALTGDCRETPAKYALSILRRAKTGKDAAQGDVATKGGPSK